MLSSLRWTPHHPPACHIRLASRSVFISRRGRNLTERYRRLENTARAKSEPARYASLLSQGSASAVQFQSDERQIPFRSFSSPDTIAGFAIPKEPQAPTEDECCMSGCAVCVYDLYEDALTAYKQSVISLRATLSAQHIPESEWPARIRIDTGNNPQASATAEKSQRAIFSAFEETEQSLNEKRGRRAAVEAEKRARGDLLVCGEEKVRLDLRGLYEGVKWVVFPNR